MLQSPLYTDHTAAGARLMETAGWAMPSQYGDVATEYRAVREAAGLIDLSHRGKLSMTGNDRQSFLHRIVTNEIGALQPGDGAYAGMLTPQGKMISDMTVYVRDDDLLFDTDPGMASTLQEALDRYALMDDVTIADVTEQYGLVGVHGPQADTLLNAVLGSFSVPALPGHVACAYQGISLMIARSHRTGEVGYDVYVPVDRTADIWTALLENGEAIGVQRVGIEALEILRIEAGIPRYGAELDARIIPNEAGIKDRAISFTKGCYIGQEPVVMIEHRGQPNKLLAGLRIGGDDLPLKDTPLWKDDQDAGWITSSVRGQSVNGVIALGYVRRKFMKTGEQLTVEVNGASVIAEVVELPFSYRPDR